MKKIFISLLVSLFIMFVVPMRMVMIFEPRDNAFSTTPVTPTPVAEDTEV